MATMKDPYETLGVSKNASAEEIKKAYRKLALQYHPDRGGDKATEQKFKEINAAYEILGNLEKRSQYDQFGNSAFGQGFGGNQQGGFGNGGFDFSGFGFGGGFGDIFEDFFGATLSQVQAEIEISPAQAVLGDKMRLEVDRETVEFNIPPGTQNGSSFKFPGKGRAYRGGKRGDLILTVRISTPKSLTKEQRELWEKLRESEEKKRRGWF